MYCLPLFGADWPTPMLCLVTSVVCPCFALELAFLHPFSFHPSRQEAGDNEKGYWAIILNGFGVPDTEKCFSFVDESDPIDIPENQWFCKFP